MIEPHFPEALRRQAAFEIAGTEEVSADGHGFVDTDAAIVFSLFSLDDFVARGAHAVLQCPATVIQRKITNIGRIERHGVGSGTIGSRTPDIDASVH